MKRKTPGRDLDSFMVCGHRAVSAVIAAQRARRVWIDARGKRAEELQQLARDAGVPAEFASAADICKRVQHSAHQGVIAETSAPPADWQQLLSSAPAPLVALDGVTDPRNLGAVMRAARAFGAIGVIVANRRAAPLSAAAAKASAGACAFLPLYRIGNLRRALSQLQEAGWNIVGATEKAERSAADLAEPEKACWVFGDEGGGLRRLTVESCDYLVRAPTVSGDAGCLNVSAACAACMSAAARLPE